MAQQLWGRGQRQSPRGPFNGDPSNQVLQEPYRGISIPASNALALPSQQMLPNAQTVEVTYKFYQPSPLPLQTQPQQIIYQRWNAQRTDQAFLSNQMRSDWPRPQSLQDTCYPKIHGPNIDSVTGQDNMFNNVCRPKTRKTKKAVTISF